MEEELVQQFKATCFDETVITNTGMDYDVSFTDDISDIFLIVPKIKYLNGTVAVYQESVHFFIEKQDGTTTLSFHEVGYYMLTVSTSLTTTNTLINFGMQRSCGTLCTRPVCQNKGTCKVKGRNELPRDIIECPPGNGCQFVSQDVFATGEPVGDAIVVKSCDEFIDAVCNKFDTEGGKVNVFFNGHGNTGLFSINGDHVSKGNACYNKICEQLKDKIETLTLFTCSTARGTVGKQFVQCLANCLNAVVQAWERNLYTRWRRFLFFSSAPRWSIQRGFTDPFEVQPASNGPE